MTYIDLAFIQYSSGSTQECKGVMITFGNLQAAINIMDYYVNQVHRVFKEIDSFVFTCHSPCSTYSIALLESVWDSRGFPISMTWVSLECVWSIPCNPCISVVWTSKCTQSFCVYIFTADGR